MKRITVLTLILAFSLAMAVYADRDSGGSLNRAPARSSSPARVSRPAQVQARQPVRIQMNRSSATTGYHPGYKPNYGQVQRTQAQSVQHSFQRAAPQAQANRQPNAPQAQAFHQPGVARAPGVREATAVRHHAYTPGYVRKKLSNIGVKTEPRYITDRSEIISTDRAHSRIGMPSTGPRGGAFKANLVSSRQFNGSLVRTQMTAVNRPEYMQRIDRENLTETQRGRYYWHTDGGFSYSHYIDNSGYHWYGWYAGDQFFWTRNYDGRWWWYDEAYNRWNFYNDDYWWWQDPYHVGELYVYNNDSYIPANSADDPVVVSGTETSDDAVYTSPDGKRVVKIVPGDGDAFLYEGAETQNFTPIYLASGVQSMQYSDVNNGRPLEIMLKLNDGSWDLFDAEGHPYNIATAEPN
jgi:hypothetical protein